MLVLMILCLRHRILPPMSRNSDRLFEPTLQERTGDPGCLLHYDS